jgi:CheY-like chemotaxis protein
VNLLAEWVGTPREMTRAMLQQSSSHDTGSNATTSSPTAEYRVLWIERDSALRARTAELVADLGYRVTVVSDAVTAMGLVIHDIGAFDVVVMDLALPDVEGIGLARYLRSVRSDWPLVLCADLEDCAWLSVWASDGCRAADSVLVKPVDSGDLEQALRRARAAHAAC